MNYDAIILELLSRIQKLEEEVKSLREVISYASTEHTAGDNPKTTTGDILTYIESQKLQAYSSGQTELTLKANDIHKNLQLKNRMPMVCNAMRQCMADHDVVLHDTASGHSSTLEIKYFLSGKS